MTFLNAFASIPQRVIWKYEKPIENLPENVMISNWVPQRDILGKWLPNIQTTIWLDDFVSEEMKNKFSNSCTTDEIFFQEHKNVIAFISHCGQSGVYEAILTGTPVVTIPLFVDQLSNAALLHYRGVGVNLNFKTATKESILTALNAIINDTK